LPADTEYPTLVASKEPAALKEPNLLPGFLAHVFVTILGYPGPAACGPRYTMSREKHVQVDGRFADAVLGEFTAKQRQFLVAVEEKGTQDPLDRPHPGRKMSVVDQGYRYAMSAPPT
jgi:hypothetical protein